MDLLHSHLHHRAVCVRLGGLHLRNQCLSSEVLPVWSVRWLSGFADRLHCYDLAGVVLQPGPLPSPAEGEGPPQFGVYRVQEEVHCVGPCPTHLAAGCGL